MSFLALHHDKVVLRHVLSFGGFVLPSQPGHHLTFLLPSVARRQGSSHLVSGVHKALDMVTKRFTKTAQNREPKTTDYINPKTAQETRKQRNPILSQA